ncbi:MAG: flagellar basal body rod protein FlgC [Sphingomonadales bacterium]
MDLMKSIMISAAGIRAQSFRVRVISENIANASSLASEPGQDPYRRKVVSFSNELDKQLGVPMVKVSKVDRDQSEFGRKLDPGHPSADENGYVKLPNVNGLVESMDMRQALRSYEANLNSIEASKQMLMRTVDLLRE